jgi:hypothetical protein
MLLKIIFSHHYIFLNGKIIIINNRSQHKTNKDREKRNYKTEALYISGTPIKKAKNKHNLIEIHF